MAKSFLENLDIDSKELKTKRISNFVLDAQAHSETIIRTKEVELRNLENQLERVMDLGDDTTLSIANRVSKADPRETMVKIFKLKIEIKQVKEDLEVLRATHNELFPTKEA